MTQVPKIDIATEEGVTIVRLGPEYSSLYEGVLSELKHLIELAETVMPPRLVLDLGNTKYFGSAFIGFAVTLASRLRAREGGRFALSSLTPFARMALQTTRSDLLLELYDSSEAAVAAMKP